MYHNDMEMPHVISGNNLDMPIIGWFLRSVGAIFIKRNASRLNCPIYEATLAEYLSELLKQGQSMSVYIEGTRTRSGLPYPPKTKIFEHFITSYVSGDVEDIMIVPVSFSYEWVPDSAELSVERFGEKKVKETLIQTIKTFLRLRGGISDRGCAKICIGEIVKLSSFQGVSKLKKLYETNEEKFLRKLPQETRNYAEDVLHACMKSHDILPTHYVAAALLILTRIHDKTTVSLTEISETCVLLVSEIETKKHSTIGVTSGYEKALFHGVRVMKNANIINVFKNPNGEFEIEINETGSAKQSLENLFELRYMANNVLLFLASESLVALALNRIFFLKYRCKIFQLLLQVKQCEVNGGSLDKLKSALQVLTHEFTKEDIIEEARELNDKLRYDILMCKVNTNMSDHLKTTVEKMITRGIFRPSQTISHEKKMAKQRAKNWDIEGSSSSCSSDDEGGAPKTKLCLFNTDDSDTSESNAMAAGSLTEISRKLSILNVYCTVLGPHVESTVCLLTKAIETMKSSDLLQSITDLNNNVADVSESKTSQITTLTCSSSKYKNSDRVPEFDLIDQSSRQARTKTKYSG